MINVLLAEDHAVVRDGVRALLEAQADIKVVGDAANGREVVRQSRQLHPDVVVMDIAMPEDRCQFGRVRFGLMVVSNVRATLVGPVRHRKQTGRRHLGPRMFEKTWGEACSIGEHH